MLYNLLRNALKYHPRPLALAQLKLGAASPAPQFILLDLNMPVMNGWEFLAAYQQLPPVTPRPLVVLLPSSDHDLA